jgi:hypothetical protein
VVEQKVLKQRGELAQSRKSRKSRESRECKAELERLKLRRRS